MASRNKQILVVVTIILLLSAYMIQLSHFHLYLFFFFEVTLEKYCNLCKSCEEQPGIHHTCTPSLLQYSEIYGAADSDGKVHSFRTKNALCQLLKLLKIIEVILPFTKKVLKLEPCSIPRTFVRHGPTVKITGEIANAYTNWGFANYNIHLRISGYQRRLSLTNLKHRI